MNTSLVRILTMVALLGFALPAAVAQDPAVKQRMAERVSAVDALKVRKIVGENNRGFLEVRGAAAADEAKLVADENRDRSAAYEAIAKNAGTSPDAVGRSRAKRIAETSAPGVLIQAADGSWAEKK